jgi:hypothetical protein
MDRNRCQPHYGDLPKTYGGGDISGGGGKMPKFLAELAQLFYGDTPMFGLKALSMLFAQVFDDSEIRAAFGAIKAFPDFRQWEATGAAVLSDGNRMPQQDQCTSSSQYRCSIIFRRQLDQT